MTNDKSALSAQKHPDICDILDDETDFDQIPWEMALVVVTPALAQRWLEEQNDNNRTISKPHVDRLAEGLRSGTFQTTPQGISFTPEGKLLDGQHRLKAIVKTGLSLQMAVFFGVSARSFVVFDSTQKGRTLADVVRIAGISQANTPGVGNAYRVLQNWEAHRMNTGAKGVMSSDQLVEVHDAHPGIVPLVPAAQKIARETKLGAAAVTVAMYLAERDRPDVDSQPFWDSLLTGADLKLTDPILALRKFAHNRLNKRPLPDQTEWVRAILRAWIAWAEGKEVKTQGFFGGDKRPDITVAGGLYVPAPPVISEVRVIDLLEVGLLKAGDALVTEGTLYQKQATVLPSGEIELDGVAYESLNAAGAAVRGATTLGWTFWNLPSSTGSEPTSMAHLRQEYSALRRIEINKAA